MSYTVARYALWVLLSIPVAVLGFSLVGDLLDVILQDNRDRKAKKAAKDAKEQKRKSSEDDFLKKYGSGH